MSNEDGSVRYENLTQREYAAIHLRVTDPALPEWLNAMIERARRDEFAKAALQGLLSAVDTQDQPNLTGSFYSEIAYRVSTAMLAQGRKG